MCIFVKYSHHTNIYIKPMMKLRKIALSEMMLLEVNAFVEEVTAIVDKHAPESLRLSDQLILLKEQELKTSYLTSNYGRHPLTLEYNRLHEKRMAFVSVIFNQLEAINRGMYDNKHELAQRAYLVTKTYLNSLRENNSVVITAKIVGFMLQLKKNPEEMEAFIALNLKSYIDGLGKANIDCRDASLDRLRDISKRPKINKKAIAKEAQSVLRAFFEQLSHFQNCFRDLNYTPLINELNEKILEYSKKLNTRKTINKRWADEAKEAAKKEAATDSKAKPEKAVVKKDTTKTKTTEKAQEQKVEPAKEPNNLPAKIEKEPDGGPLQNLKKIMKIPNGEKGENLKKE